MTPLELQEIKIQNQDRLKERAASIYLRLSPNLSEKIAIQNRNRDFKSDTSINYDFTDDLTTHDLEIIKYVGYKLHDDLVGFGWAVVIDIDTHYESLSFKLIKNNVFNRILSQFVNKYFLYSHGDI